MNISENSTRELTVSPAGMQFASMRYGFLALRLVLQLAGLVSNCLVIASVVKFRWLKSVHNYFILSLCCCDSLLLAHFTLFKIPYEVLFVSGHPVANTFNKWKCNVLLLENTLITCQLMHLLVVCIDRFMCVHHPLDYGIRIKRFWRPMLAGCWTLGILPFTCLNCALCRNYNAESALKLLDHMKIYQHVLCHGVAAWFLVLFLLYTKAFYKLHCNIEAQRKQAKCENAARRSSVEYFASLRRDGTSSQRIPNQHTTDTQRTLMKAYAVRLGAAFVPQSLRYMQVMVPRGETALHGTIWSVLIAEAIVLTFIASSSASAFIYGCTQSSFKAAFKQLLRSSRPLRSRRRRAGEAGGGCRIVAVRMRADGPLRHTTPITLQRKLSPYS